MEVTSRDGNMVVDFYPVKTWDNKLINNRMLKVLSFKGDTQKKMLITRQEFYYQVREYILQCKYKVTSTYALTIVAELTPSGSSGEVFIFNSKLFKLL